MNNNDVYDLWLSYSQLKSKPEASNKLLSQVAIIGRSPTSHIIKEEISRTGTGNQIDLYDDISEMKTLPHLLILPEESLSAFYSRFNIEKHEYTFETGNEGYIIDGKNNPFTLITAKSSTGLLYGTFSLLRSISCEDDIKNIYREEKPSVSLRMLNHWDNFDRSVERGYAGLSLWKWDELPGKVDERYYDYARACASIGINASVLNNVNDAQNVLKNEYLEKVAVLAGIFRPYGIKTFISVNFASPIIVGEMESADPLDENVKLWWKTKVEQIYRLIPDFGGFLVKADSEGQPGPFSYGRSHSEGANMLAEALEPKGGKLIWRAFVYGHGEKDRAATAYTTFKSMDGDFNTNVALQVKNGPIDFQPREPVQPLFGAMPKTDLFMEFQITQEYLGQGNHIVYLAPMWKEILDFDTERETPVSTIRDMMKSENPEIGGIAAVANTGDDKNWCGSPLHPVNWYAYGRLAWNPDLDTKEIALEWIYQTFGSNNEKVVKTLLSILMDSWETCIDYMTPLCLHHIMKEGHHYGPDPAFDGGQREDWRSTYYHRADSQGLGFDRTESGSGAVTQYFKPIADRFGNPESCPEKYLLWFHHIPWTKKLSSGLSLKEELENRYNQGVTKAENFLTRWKEMESLVDKPRYKAILAKLEIQAKDAREWRDVCLDYFLSFAKKNK